MRSHSKARNVSVGLRAGLFTLASGLWACGSSTTQSGTGATTGDASAGAGDSGPDATTTPNNVAEAGAEGSTASGPCSNPTVKIDFSPMYSAFVPGSTMHTFQIPAVTDDGSQATWSVSDPTQASLVAQTFNGLPGVMITVQGTATGSTGHITVYATKSSGECGSSTLTVTSATEDDWTIGNDRYNDGIALTLTPPPGFDGGIMGMGDGGMGFGEGGGGFRTNDGGSFFERDGGTACTNCHGPTATSSVFRTVAHTPEQTGGFSDDQLIQIITQGNVPDGGYFDPTVINADCADGGASCMTPADCTSCAQRAYSLWHSFHQWSDITSDEYRGIVVYLRSLTPAAQSGTRGNFGRGAPPGDAATE